MSDIVIRVENISKLYQLGEISTGTISRDLHRWWAKVRGQEDPFLKIGQINNRIHKTERDCLWALKDISFDVYQGEVLGIIGKNGAGKSTLLKILSRVTKPTTGRIGIKGRIASLLEVGTGFHQELTGRENIFLNGAIMGMTKIEIRSKIDEVIDFAGVEKHIDTPVKRYSSGMYVRLAFAVAAHLDPEILIVDEVLAVGDIEFQKKCLGKMKDVSQKDGRTVLFVSHNLDAIQKLCNRGVLLKNGTVAINGGIQDVVGSYLKENKELNPIRNLNINHSSNSNEVYFTKITILDKNDIPTSSFKLEETWQVMIEINVRKPLNQIVVSLGITSEKEIPIIISRTNLLELKSGVYNIVFSNQSIFLGSGEYSLSIGLTLSNINLEHHDSLITFRITDIYSIKTKSIQKDNGIIMNQLGYHLKKFNFPITNQNKV